MAESTEANNPVMEAEQPVEPEEELQETTMKEEPVLFKMSVQGGGGGGKVGFISGPTVNQPVHEQMVMATLFNSDYRLDPSISFHNLRLDPNRNSNLSYFIQGVLSNEDPETLLFDEKATNNLTYSAGFDWGGKFK